MNLSTRMRRLGWRCFGLMWIPFGTFFVGMLGMPDGSYGWSDLPLLARASILAFAPLFALAIGMLTASPIVASLANRRVLAAGEPAKAVVLGLADTGTTINQNPVVRFRLEVHPEEGDAFEADVERLVPRLQIPLLQPGVIVRVKYDPATRAVALLQDATYGMEAPEA